MLPLLHKLDVSLTQNVFKDIKGKRNAGQFRIDIQNAGNMIDSELGCRPARDSQQHPHDAGGRFAGRLSYRMQVVNSQLVTQALSNPQTYFLDVYQFMLSFRYSFN